MLAITIAILDAPQQSRRQSIAHLIDTTPLDVMLPGESNTDNPEDPGTLMTYPNSRVDCSEIHAGCQALRRDSLSNGVNDPENLPFMLWPEEATTAVLLIHGFTATPWEMRPLAEFLAEAGIASLAVCLPGHGTSPEDLASRHWQEWRDAGHEGYNILREEFQSIYAMGMSTGCLLSLSIAGTNPLSGLVLFSPYLRVLHWLAPHAGWLRWLHPYQEKPTEAGSGERYYNRWPLAGIHQINLLLRSVRCQLPRICCPVLAFNGEGDQTVDIQSGRRLVDMLGSTVKIHEQYGPEVPHVLTREENPRRWTMFAQAVRFIQSLETPDVTAPTR